MNSNAKLLNFIYKNAEMGLNTISQISDITTNSIFKKYLLEQYNDYNAIHNKAQELLNIHGFDEEGVKTFETIKTYLMINMGTLIDKSTSHIAEMMITGSTMGITDAIKHQNDCADAQKEILSLMKQLQKSEEKNLDNLKKFL